MFFTLSVMFTFDLGDLFSVSPWMAKRLENLFVLNERVALLGRWKHGFFGMVPVGATNVGSIKVNFDQVGHARLFLIVTLRRADAYQGIAHQRRFAPGTPRRDLH